MSARQARVSLTINIGLRLSLARKGTDPSPPQAATGRRLVCDEFRRARAGTARQPATNRMVRARIDELLGHEPDWMCGHCAAAAKARASHVLLIVAAWQQAARRAGR